MSGEDQERFEDFCPCHGGLFSVYGQVDLRSPVPYVGPLPCLETKVEDSKVSVRVPLGPRDAQRDKLK